MPFGEYRPIDLPQWLAPNIFDTEAGTRRITLRAGSIDVEPLVCWENLFADDVRKTASSEPTVIAHIVNDAWFGPTSAADLHNIASVFRAAESGRPLVLSSNAGPSLIIDARGRSSRVPPHSSLRSSRRACECQAALRYIAASAICRGRFPSSSSSRVLSFVCPSGRRSRMLARAMARSRASGALLTVLLLLSSRLANAEPADDEQTKKEESPPPPSKPPLPDPPAQPPALDGPPMPFPTETQPALKLTPLGYVEAFYSYNFRRPSNGITNFRGFDNRHNTVTLSNVALGTGWEIGPVSGRVILQIGSTPSSYYASEPLKAGANAANASGPETWKYLQEAWVGWKAPVGRGLFFQFGLVPSPIGVEAFAVKDHWTWSRSNLFFGLPYYHAGLRGTYELSDHFTWRTAVFNGWNSVVDNNEEKSVETDITYHDGDRYSLQLLYFGGIERTTGSPEGPYWRHHFDAVGQAQITERLGVAAQADYGFEPNRIGTARWWAVAAAARYRVLKPLFFVARGDRFTEHLATANDGRVSTPLFWAGSEWITSGTLTADFRPHDHISIRLEYRLDVAERSLFFRGDVEGDGSSTRPFVPNARYQETLLLGATAWF